MGADPIRLDCRLTPIESNNHLLLLLLVVII